MVFNNEYLEKLLKQLEELNDSIENSNLSESEFDELMKELFYSVYNESYVKLTEGYIFEKEYIVQMLEFYIKNIDIVKVKNIIRILNKYYKGSVDELMSKYIKEENYENCSVIRDGLNS